MPIKWDVRFSEQLETLSGKFEAIDMDRVMREGIEQTADDMAETVRLQVSNHPDIKSPADLISPYEGGDGPPMARKQAWNVKQQGPSTFIVEPDPRVRQRAIILEYGTRDPIKARSADAMKFTVNGVPMFREEVSGIEARGYWQAAMQQIRSEKQFTQNLEDEWADELERYF